MIGLQSTGELHLTKGQLLKKANKRIEELEAHIAKMEEERKKGVEEINNRGWKIVQLRMAVTALCNQYKVSTERCKEIYDAFCAEEDKKILAQQQESIDKAKAQFQQDIKDGKKVEFTAMDLRGDKPSENQPCSN